MQSLLDGSEYWVELLVYLGLGFWSARNLLLKALFKKSSVRSGTKIRGGKDPLASQKRTC